MYGDPNPPSADERRTTFFAAITGHEHAEVSGKSTNVGEMLRTAYSRPDGTVDTRAASKALKVSQRTVQRWVKGTQAPKGENLSKLQKGSRKAATTKAGRAQAVQKQKKSAFAQKGAKLTIRGNQGVPGTNVLGQTYKRFRNASLQLTPQEYQDLLDAYAEGGDSGIHAYLESEFSAKYGAGAWEMTYISEINFSEI
ncbi:XRE family transcriptional regulator [Sinomonas sp. JGH33]|uniref:XRE family transcriptional regulator n=1 Tax=Sinomonas terricola TaxID=3110330 RepID=A0ABU5TCC4_9MICC|nr:XRE family transcriptional regulator [Sinomonas sp. JGH33]MEA5457318.1 XRE family transcriptional regulator [Sinomonas sp. JGH33]